MPRRPAPRAEPGIDHRTACETVGSLLAGDARARIVERALRSPNLVAALRSLRGGMRDHAFATTDGPVSVAALVEDLDARTRREGFSILSAWDPKAHRFTRDNNPVLLLDYAARAGIAPGTEPRALAVLLDGYFLYLLALLAMRSWDDEPAEGLRRVTGLLEVLQGPAGSGLRFMDDAETLLLLAISQYQPNEEAYDRLLERLRGLDLAGRLRFARVGAPDFGSHLRWGFRFMYHRDPARMRADNTVDYPWLQFCLATLMEGFAAQDETGAGGGDRSRVAEALLNGFSADPGAFTGETPAFLAQHGEEHAWLRDRLLRHRDELLPAFAEHRPTERGYSGLAFDFNFMHNAMVARVAVALGRPSAPNLPFEALFARPAESPPLSRSPEVLARMMMDLSAADPTRLVHRGAGLVAYDAAFAASSYDAAVEALRAMDAPPA